ncbi:hypothetical protein C8R47DRAFT_1216450 [Mycena vitilis]|nr:hypothetical protein C8R47DRAFT_1216450 [Mycena vitilis]
MATFRAEPLSESAILETYRAVRSQGPPYIVAFAADSPGIIGYDYASGYRTTRKAYCSALMDGLLFRLKNLLSLQGSASSKAPAVSEVLCVMALDTAGKSGGFGLRD